MSDELVSSRSELPACSKQLWVMLTFSDDEAYAPGRDLPVGLRAHLSRCPTCRATAERLSAVADGLAALGADDGDAGLGRRAVSHVRTVLQHGARPTGRVPLHVVQYHAPMDEPRRPQIRAERTRFVAVAACMALLLISGGVWQAMRRADPHPWSTFDAAPYAVHASRTGGTTALPLTAPEPEITANHESSPIDEVDDADAFCTGAPGIFASPYGQHPVRTLQRSAPASAYGASRSGRLLDNPASAVSTTNSTKDRR